MNSKKWLKIFIGSLFLFISSIALINYLVDPFNIFHTKLLKTAFQPNERFIKIEYLEKNKNKFNGYMFGSSRIGTTHTSTIEKYIQNSKFYNFTISDANLYDYQKHLENFIKEKYPIKTLYLQIDLKNMHYYGRSSSDYLKKLHPHVMNQKLVNYYIGYLSGFFYFNIKGKIEKNIYNDNPTLYNWETGVWSKPLKDKMINSNCSEYEKQEPTFNVKKKRIISYTQSKNDLKAIKRIKKLCNDNGINLIVFITPHNKNMMDEFIINDYINFLQDLVSVTDYYDFSGYNSITTNNCNYYEHSHYRSKIGDLIAAKIFNDKTINIPDDFGFFVTKDNFNEHKVYMIRNIKDYDKLKETIK